MGNKSSREDDFDELDLKPPEPPGPLPKRSRTNPPATPPPALVPAIVAEPVLLEANTLPGFTPRSLLPLAAAADGVGFRELCLELVARAL